MKRLLTIGLMLAAALALTNCVDQFETPIQESDIIVDETTTLQGEGEPFEVFVETAETKLDYDGNVYSWSTAIDKNGNEQEPDKIFLYSVASSGASTSLQAHNEFTYIGGGKFVGNLAKGYTLPDENNWYGVYGYSSSAPTVTIGVIAEGSYTQKQMSNNSKRHLAGSGYPMYGVKKNVPKNKSPKFSMSHLSSIIALEIVNNGAGGDIVIKDAQIEATEEIVGDFTVDLLGASSPTFTKGSNVSKIARVELTNAATVTYGNSATLYLAVKPFDASNKDLTISVNGSARTVKMPANTVFRAGTVTKLRVPVEALAKPVISDALYLTSKGERIADGEDESAGSHIVGNVFTLKNCSEKDILVNGEEVKAYVLGNTSGTTGSITITGFAKDLINALPVSFYVSGWDGRPAEMTVNKIKVWFPINPEATELLNETDKGDKFNERENYYERIDTTTKSYKYDLTLKGRGNLSLLKLLGGNENLEVEGWFLLEFAPSLKTKIPFKGIPNQGYFDGSNVIVLDEEIANKNITDVNLNTFMENWGITVDDIRKILMLQEKDIPVSDVTRSSITSEHKSFTYKKGLIFYSWHEELISTNTKYEYSPKWPPTNDSPLYGDDGMIKAVTTFHNILMRKSIPLVNVKIGDMICPTPYHLIRMLRECKISVELGTTKEGPCVVFWGLDAMGPNKSPNNE